MPTTNSLKRKKIDKLPETSAPIPVIQNAAAPVTEPTVRTESTSDTQSTEPNPETTKITDQTAEKSKKNTVSFLVLFMILAMIIIVILVLLAMSIINNGTNKIIVTPQPTITVTVEPSATAELVLNVNNPIDNQTVNGKFNVEGTATASLQEISLKVYDNQANLLGEGSAQLASSNPNPVHTWAAVIQLTKTPKTNIGYVLIFPKNEGASSSLAKNIAIKFESYTAANRIKLNTPLKNMKYDGGTVTFRGQMKDFFEGTMGLRLRGDNGGILYDQGINSLSDNYGQYANFLKDVNPGTIPTTAGANGQWELYDTSMADGSVQILLIIPVSL